MNRILTNHTPLAVLCCTYHIVHRTSNIVHLTSYIVHRTSNIVHREILLFLIMKLLRVFVTGLFISFLGTLPLGTLNLASMQISISDGIRPAIYFALGALLVEVVYVRISLVAMDWVRRRKKLFRWLEWFTIVII